MLDLKESHHHPAPSWSERFCRTEISSITHATPLHTGPSQYNMPQCTLLHVHCTLHATPLHTGPSQYNMHQCTLLHVHYTLHVLTCPYIRSMTTHQKTLHVHCTLHAHIAANYTANWPVLHVTTLHTTHTMAHHACNITAHYMYAGT